MRIYIINMWSMKKMPSTEERIQAFYKEMSLSKEFKKKLEEFELLIRIDEKEKFKKEIEEILSGDKK